LKKPTGTDRYRLGELRASELNVLCGDGRVFPTFAKAEWISNPAYFLETQLPITAGKYRH